MYRPHNKLLTAVEIFRGIRNWADGLELRLRPGRKCLRLLEFKNGINVVVRGGGKEWAVVHELFFAGGYEKAFQWLALRPEARPVVLDMGGNVGLFALLAAYRQPKATVISFEPGPPNIRQYRMNMLANPALASRIELRETAVAFASGEAEWNFDEENPGGSFLVSGGEAPVGKEKVKMLSFGECLELAPGEIALVKIDIEGSEWEILEQTPAETWERIQAIAVEIHPRPSRERSLEVFLKKMAQMGFVAEKETAVSYFLHR